MRISDWSSDVCSSDLLKPVHGQAPGGQIASRHDADIFLREKRLFDDAGIERRETADRDVDLAGLEPGDQLFPSQGNGLEPHARRQIAHPLQDAGKDEQMPDVRSRDVEIAEIGRASCRERVWQDVSISVVDVSLKKKKTD